MTQVDEHIYRALTQHVVALAWADKAKPGVRNRNYKDPSDARAVSGFLLEIERVWLFVTAGHVLSDLRARLEHHRELITASLIDDLQGHRLSDQLPIPLQPDRFIVVDNEDGIDLGFFVLSEFVKEGLRRNGKTAITEALVSLPTSGMTVFLMWGLPTTSKEISCVSTPDGPRFSYEMGAPIIRVHPTDKTPPTFQRASEELYAIVGREFRDLDGHRFLVPDMDGMSGGPIFGIDTNANRYWLVAIQSRWDPNDRVLAAGYALRLVRAIKAAFAAVSSESQAQPSQSAASG